VKYYEVGYVWVIGFGAVAPLHIMYEIAPRMSMNIAMLINIVLVADLL
jgi:hypothetical protein